MPASHNPRVLIYSHDTFGLGHLRRCQTIAHALADSDPAMSVLILSGSPVAGSFDFHPRVDFVRIPGVAKRGDGLYDSLNLLLDIQETLAIRASIIRHTAELFKPDLFIVDKEPLGLHGEIAETLFMLKQSGTFLILGLRDVLDAPARLRAEWDRPAVRAALEDLYDALWVYGLPELCDPLEGIDLPASVRRKTAFTGYLRRGLPADPPALPSPPFILVTPGGGGDGDILVDWVLRAYEHDAAQPRPTLPLPARIVLGPLMDRRSRDAFLARAAGLERVQAMAFDTRMEVQMQATTGVVAMGGYNTFCEILSFDKRALIVPRTKPRLEQYIRAQRAQELGLCAMLPDDGRRCQASMADALRRLPRQPAPSDAGIPGLLDGLNSIGRLAHAHLDHAFTHAASPAALRSRQRVLA